MPPRRAWPPPACDPDALDAAWCVRTPSAAARATSRSLGRSLARTAARVVPDLPIALADGRPPVQPVAFGLLATAVGCAPDEAALASAHGTAAALSAAGLRLLSLDPFDVAAVVSDLRPEIDGVADSHDRPRRRGRPPPRVHSVRGDRRRAPVRLADPSLPQLTAEPTRTRGAFTVHDIGTPGHTHDHATTADRGDGAFRVGIGGPVGTGKTALVAALCRAAVATTCASAW